jgi:hypothetical protein
LRVFVSHSAKDDQRAGAVLDAVISGLREKGYTPLADRDGLKPAMEWRSELYRWLAECDAGIVLLNEKALASKWVQREINILMWRRALSGHPVVVPVLLDGLKTADIKKHGLSELEPIELARDDRATEVTGVVDEILGRFAPLPPQAGGNDPMGDWLGRISGYLAEVRSEDDLLRAAGALGMTGEVLPQVVVPIGGRHHLAYQLLAPGLAERLCPAIAALAPSLGEQWLWRLIVEVRPSWVDVEAVRALLPGPRGRRVALLNGEEPGTGEDYVDRATCRPIYGVARRTVGEIPVGETGEEFPAALADMLLDLHGYPPAKPLSVIRPGRKAYYLIVDIRNVGLERALACLEQAHDQVPGVVVLAMTGSDLPRAVPATRDDVHVLPPMAEGDELEAFQRRREFEEIFCTATGRRSIP